MDTIQLDLSARSTTVFAALSVLPGKQRLCMGDREVHDSWGTGTDDEV